MRKVKRLTALLLAAALSMSLLVVAHADGDEAPAPLAPVCVTGDIVEEFDDGFVVEAGDDDSYYVKITGDTYVVDAAEGEAISLADRDNDSVVVYLSPVMTRSIPPQSNAYVIICNVSEDAMPPRYGRVDEINADDDAVKVTVEAGGLIVTLDDDADLDNIAVGTDLLMWFAFVATSFPAQAVSLKTVVLGQSAEAAAVEEEAEAEEAEEEAVEEEAAEEAASEFFLSIDEVNVVDDVTLVPLRVVVEALGYAVSWNDESKMVLIEKDDASCEIAIGDPMVSEVELDAAPVIIDDWTFVPVSFMELVLGLGCAVEEDGILFTIE